MSSIIGSTKDKTIIAWESGWAAYISCSVLTEDDPMPHIKLYAGKRDRGIISALPNQQNWEDISNVIGATRSDLSVGITGVTTQVNRK